MRKQANYQIEKLESEIDDFALVHNGYGYVQYRI